MRNLKDQQRAEAEEKDADDPEVIKNEPRYVTEARVEKELEEYAKLARDDDQDEGPALTPEQ